MELPDLTKTCRFWKLEFLPQTSAAGILDVALLFAKLRSGTLELAVAFRTLASLSVIGSFNAPESALRFGASLVEIPQSGASPGTPAPGTEKRACAGEKPWREFSFETRSRTGSFCEACPNFAVPFGKMLPRSLWRTHSVLKCFTLRKIATAASAKPSGTSGE